MKGSQRRRLIDLNHRTPPPKLMDVPPRPVVERDTLTLFVPALALSPRWLRPIRNGPIFLDLRNPKPISAFRVGLLPEALGSQHRLFHESADLAVLDVLSSRPPKFLADALRHRWGSTTFASDFGAVARFAFHSSSI